MTLLDYLTAAIPVSEKLKQEIDRISKTKKAEKGQFLLRSGDRCNDLYFVERGLLRGFYFDDEREITNWLAIDGEFATSFYSFVARTQCFESIEVLEASDLLQITYDDLQKLYKDYPETERIGRILTENYYVKLDGRILGLQFKTAKERYQQLLVNNPVLLQRAPLGYIASYLGITQETLSRIRAQY